MSDRGAGGGIFVVGKLTSLYAFYGGLRIIDRELHTAR